MRSSRTRPTSIGRSRTALLLLLASGSLAVAACAGSEAAPDTTPSTTAPATTTTARPTTTTSTTSSTTTTTEPATTTTIPPDPVYPLTGIVVTDPAIASRPAVVVKIDNAPGARPQTGFNSADLVYEEIVNDNLTRFAMVFQMGDSDPVGPVRSGRLQDIDLFGSLNRPLFAWSGGNATVTNAIRSSDLIELGPSTARVYYRSRDRSTPHNLYTSTPQIRTFTPFGAGPPPQQFAFRSVGESSTQGQPSLGVAVKLDSIDVQWDWDAASGTYLRTMEGRAHNDAATAQVNAQNVVVLSVEYLPGISGSPDAQTVGTGEAHVFTDGRVIRGSWTRLDRLQPFTLTADDGSVIELTPGRTWIELPRPKSVIPLEAAAG
jgi:hypothetical protein